MHSERIGEIVRRMRILQAQILLTVLCAAAADDAQEHSRSDLGHAYPLLAAGWGAPATLEHL